MRRKRNRMVSKTARLSIIAVVWIAAIHYGAAPAQQKNTFKVKTELVEVRAVVTDKHGRIIAGLKKDDFELLDNKRPQQISFFSVVTSLPAAKQVPAKKAAAAEIPAPKPIGEQLPEAPRRSVTIFVDTFHLCVTSLMRVKQELHRFVDEQLTEQDAIALIPSAGTLGMAEQFTRDRLLLRYAIERLNVAWCFFSNSLFTPSLAGMIMLGDPDAILVGGGILRSEGNFVLDLQRYAGQVLAEASYRRQAAFVTLKDVVERMKELPGQRLLVIFSDGFTIKNDRGIDEPFDLQSVIGAAARSGVTIYSIYAKGLQASAYTPAVRLSPSATRVFDKVMSSAALDATGNINSLAYNTGGEAYYTTNDLSGALSEALDLNRIYYSLAYYLPNPDGDRKLHRVTVRVKNHPEYVVRAPKYFQPETAKPESGAAPETPSQHLLQAINAPMPSTGIDVAATADFIEGEADNAQVSLTVHIGGDKLQYREVEDRYSFAFELSTVLYDSSGKRSGGLTDSIQGKLTPEQLALARKNGFQIVRRFALKPGVYQMRVGVLEPASGQMGTASSWVEVPDLTRRQLALSSIIFVDSPQEGATSASSEISTTVSRSKFVLGIRVFQREQSGAYAFRIYNAASGTAGPRLEMMTEFLQRGKMMKQTAWQELSASQIAGDGKGIEVAGLIKSGELASGIYEMRITVRDLQSKRTDQRTTVFAIE